MAIDPVLFQAAATIVAAQIEARAAKGNSPNQAFTSAVRQKELDAEVVDVYGKLQAAARLIEQEQAQTEAANARQVRISWS